MGKKKLYRMLEETLVKVVREVSKVVKTIPEECKFCGSLGDKTPAQKAGIKFPFRDWLDIVKGGENA